jgi:hypothetical protein
MCFHVLEEIRKIFFILLISHTSVKKIDILYIINWFSFKSYNVVGKIRMFFFQMPNIIFKTMGHPKIIAKILSEETRSKFQFKGIR